MQCKKTFFSLILLCAILQFTISCTPAMRGAPSLTLLSRDITPDSPCIEIIGEEDKESQVWTWTLFFLYFGDHILSDEACVSRLLDKHNADLLVNANIYYQIYGIPYLFMQQKTTAKGIPARFVSTGVEK